MSVRPRLLAVAQRVLGTRSDAEDIVQDAWLRWQTCDRSDVQNPTAFLVTTTTRLALNSTQSARGRHETSVEHRLDTPNTGDELTDGAARRERLEEGIRVLLERLSGAERAAFVLRHAFDYPYSSIAELLHRSEDNVRQLVSRARRHLEIDHRRSVDVRDHERLLSVFVAATQSGELALLESVLTAGAACRASRHDHARHRGPRQRGFAPIGGEEHGYGQRSVSGAPGTAVRDLITAGTGEQS